MDDCSSFKIDIGNNGATERGEKDDSFPAVTTRSAPLAAAEPTTPFSACDVRRQKPFELPKLRAQAAGSTARTVESFTTSASSIMERSSRTKPIFRKPEQTGPRQPGVRNSLASREKAAGTAAKRKKWQRGVAGAKRCTNNGSGSKSKRDCGPIKLPAGQQPYVSDPTQTSVLPPDISSLRWEYALDDQEKETERLLVYKANRRKRYLAAANMALDKYSATKRTTSSTVSSLTSLSLSSPAESPRTLTAPRAADGPGLLPRIPGVDRLYPARTANPKLLVGCS